MWGIRRRLAWLAGDVENAAEPLALGWFGGHKQIWLATGEVAKIERRTLRCPEDTNAIVRAFRSDLVSGLWIGPFWIERCETLGRFRSKNDIHFVEVRGFVIPKVKDVQGLPDLDVAETQALVPVVATAINPELPACPLTETFWGQGLMEQRQLAEHLVDGNDAIHWTESLVEGVYELPMHHDGESVCLGFGLHLGIPFRSEAPPIGAITVCDRCRERRQRSGHAKRKTEAPAGKPSWQLAGCRLRLQLHRRNGPAGPRRKCSHGYGLPV